MGAIEQFSSIILTKKYVRAFKADFSQASLWQMLVWVLLLVFFLVSVVLYNSQLQAENDYFGFVDLDFSLGGILVCVLCLLLISLLYPREISSPSQFFIAIYLLLTAFPCSVYWSSTGLLGPVEAIVLFSILLFPVLLLQVFRKIRFVYFRILSFSESFMPFFLVGFLILTAVVGFYLGEQYGGFDIELMYERRMAGREIFPSNPFAAYFMAMALNGVAPYLAFFSAYRQRVLLFIPAIGFTILGFWLLGVKAPAFYVVVMYALGLRVRKYRFQGVSSVLILGVFVLFAIAFFEYYFYSRSLVADYVIRRMFLVSTQIQTYFYDFLSSREGWYEILFGGDIPPGVTPPFHIGLKYFGSESTNANTNAFLYAAGQGGLLGYCLSVVFVVVFMLLGDWLYKSQAYEGMLPVIIIYGINLLEQSFTTAFVSSGILLLTMMVLFFSYKSTPCVNVRL